MPTGDFPFSSDSRAIKEAHFKSLTIGENLKTKKVNQVPLEDILENSIKLRGPDQHVYGDITFENVDINGKIIFCLVFVLFFIQLTKQHCLRNTFYLDTHPLLHPHRNM